MKATRKMPLFIITGASCVGKSAMCEVLFQSETGYIVLESDILWSKTYDTPNDGYRAFRAAWMRVCRDISQIGMPVVLCGCAVPKQFEPLEERGSFTRVHYLAVVCDDDVLEKRLTARRITDEKWIASSLGFNRWLKEHAGSTNPPVSVLDNTELTPHKAAAAADRWICKHMEEDDAGGQ